MLEGGESGEAKGSISKKIREATTINDQFRSGREDPLLHCKQQIGLSPLILPDRIARLLTSNNGVKTMS
jgi:hypothetical protein